MARKPTQKQLFTELTARYGVEIAAAFAEAVSEIKAGVELRRAISALERGDITGAIEALHLDPAAYGPMLDRVRGAYVAGGATAAGALPSRNPDGDLIIIRFDARNPRAEAWLSQHSSDLVTRIVDDQRAAVRTALTAGMEAGANPRTTALDIVGRLNRATGKRTGGILGLTSQQADYVARARSQLASGDPAELRAYLTRGRIDKRFNRTVARAIREGAPIPADVQGKMVTAYESQLLRLRGETIGKHEAFTALGEAKQESYRQAVDSGSVRASDVRKTWRHFSSENPRTQHIAMAGQSVGMDEYFVFPDGTRMLYPHDPSAPAKHTLGCKCQADYRIDFLANIQ